MKDRIYFYTLYERLWHWLQAVAIIALLITGFEISFTSLFSGKGFALSVSIHNILGIILSINAFLAFFYHIVGGILKQYIPGIEDFFSLGFKHASYYLIGIFRGDPHPFDKTPEKRLLPLQKITYFGMLHILLPFMVITGLLKWSAMYTQTYITMFGGLHILGPLHRFGAWLFLSFVIIHVYMITTGPSPLASLKSMITGYEERIHSSS